MQHRGAPACSNAHRLREVGSGGEPDAEESRIQTKRRLQKEESFFQQALARTEAWAP